MEYFSTRNKEKKVSSPEAILEGLANDGGLYVTDTFPKFDIEKNLSLDYIELSYRLVSLYFDEFEEKELKSEIEKAYRENFPKNPVPIKKCENKYFMELYHGPTGAFKDFALQLLPGLIKLSKKNLDIDRHTLILVATSGDTGSAALEGFSNTEGIDICVFYPERGVSDIQKLQMISVKEENALAVGIDGNFDDAQVEVKSMFENKDLKKALEEKNIYLSSANSINIGRLFPQIVYYFYGYSYLRKSGELRKGEKISFSVPTGNFGDVLAGYYAKKMGLPIDKLIVASNENNVLTEFFETGIYDSDRDLILTKSPSMDILISSNLERLIYYQTQSTSKVKSLMEDLKKDRRFEISETFVDFKGGYATEEETRETIKNIYEKYGYVIDPHTAVATFVSKKVLGKEKVVILSTASPFKFPVVVSEAIGLETTENQCKNIENLSKKWGIEIPEKFEKLKNSEGSEMVVSKEYMESAILSFMEGKNG